MSYVAPVKDMLFCIRELAGRESIGALPGLEAAGLSPAGRVEGERG